MEPTKKYQLYLPGIHLGKNANLKIVSADVKDNTTRIGFFESKDSNVELISEKNYNTKDFSTFSEIVNQFIADLELTSIARLSVIVPGPVINGKSEPERLPWKLDSVEIANQTKIDKVLLINDLEASAYGLSGHTEKELIEIHASENPSLGNVAILAPGSGLGEAGLFWDGAFLRPFATEGGHCEFSPRTNDEVEFYQYLHQIYSIVSWETVLSESGLFNIYRFLRDVKKLNEPAWLTKEIEAGNFVQSIIEGASRGEDRICIITIDTFIVFLAREANSLVLKLKATGGLVLSGILPVKMKQFLTFEKFYKHFIVSDKMGCILKDTPIFLQICDKSALIGAATYVAFSEK